MRPLILTILSIILSTTVLLVVSESPSITPQQCNWGTYRPGLYFGTRCEPHYNSPLFGIAWTSDIINNYTAIDSLRHDAEERDSIEYYSYTDHNGDNYAIQDIIDSGQKLKLKIEYIQPELELDSKDKWISRITVSTANGITKPILASFSWYIALTSNLHSMKLDSSHSNNNNNQWTVNINTSKDSTFIDNYTLLVELLTDNNNNDSSNKHHSHSEFSSSSISVLDSWNAKKYLKQQLIDSFTAQYEKQQRAIEQAKFNNKNQPEPQFRPIIAKLNNKPSSQYSNLLLTQHLIQLPFTIQFIMAPSKSIPTTANNNHELLIKQYLNSNSLTLELLKRSNEFQHQFHQSFESITALTKPQQLMAKSTLANLLGGIGYWNGNSRHLVPNNSNSNNIELQPYSNLFSAVPSRSFFPRGFLWDEGFHSLIIQQWNIKLSIKILNSWLQHIELSPESIINGYNGWLPREQILGAEARNRVPNEFQLQKTTIANPPTLILAIGRLIQRVESNSIDSTILYEFLLNNISALIAHVDWYFRTQSSNRQLNSRLTGSSYNLNSSTTFRWAGRTKTHCLASGLDDYPRARWIPTIKDKSIKSTNINNNTELEFGLEGHVDLHCWMTAITKTMSIITDYIHKHHPINSNNTVDYSLLSIAYLNKSLQLNRLLNRFHWNSATNTYCDYAFRNGTRVFICHTGYITLFPFILGLIPPTAATTVSTTNNNQLNSIFQLLIDEKQLYNPSAGILSLSRLDSKFGSSEDYWRGNIWININYLILQALKAYSNPQQYWKLLNHLTPISINSNSSINNNIGEFYNQLRSTLINTIYRNYRDKGYLYEQYSALDGIGKRSHPFTGWTALIINIMAEKY